jgi:hypothetical protein
MSSEPPKRLFPHHSHFVPSSGGSAANSPRPIRRFWKKKDVPVEASVMKFYGIGVHFYAKVKEHDNPIREVSDNERHEFVYKYYYDDVRGKGRIFEKRFNTEVGAWRWIKKIVRENFPNQPVEYDDGNKRTWHYKDGD